MPAEETARALRRHLAEIGTLAGVYPEPRDTPETYAARVKDGVRALRASAGITWSEYVVIDGYARIAPVERPGQAWPVQPGQTLADLAGKIGTWETLTS